jgi:hypothetical protein
MSTADFDLSARTPPTTTGHRPVESLI